MADPGFAFATIDQLGAAYRAGSISPVTITRLCLDRIERDDRRLNAFQLVLADTALEQAAQAERELNIGQNRGPLHGVPVAVKDLVDMAGLPTRCGAPVRDGHVAECDSSLIIRLREAGAVLIGKTRLIEFAYMMTHPAEPRTNNPWMPSRSSGGSSGGSAAALAAGQCYAAIGSDSGGSIRVPSAWCGVVGLKPTYGLVPTDGVFPLAASLDTVGPMARTCADAAYLLGVWTGQQHDASPVSLAGLRLGILTHARVTSRIAPDVAAVFDAALDRLRTAGADLTEIVIDDLDLACAGLMLIMGPEACAVHSTLFAEHADRYAPETRAAIEVGHAVPASAYLRALRFRALLADRFMSALDKVDALVSPSVAIVSPDVDPPSADGMDFIETQYSAPYNLSGLPALTLPCGLTADGLPVGLQVAGRPFDEERLLGIGAACEQLWPPAIPPGF